MELQLAVATAHSEYLVLVQKQLLVTDGVFQALGGVLVINAFLNPQERTVTKTRAAQLQVAPA